MREDNSAADEMANKAMDTQGSVGDCLVPFESNELFALDSAPYTATADMPEGVAGSVPDNAPSDPNASDVLGNSRDRTEAIEAMETERYKGTVMSTEISTTGNTGTYTLWIKEHFDAAHALVGYPGECRNLHGHTWDVEVSVVGTKLDEVGIVYDFKDLKSNLMSILDNYDHAYLNEVPPFDAINATAENLARVIYEQMETLLPKGIALVEVGVWESPIAKLTYRK
jgi:6-pyruvoyltetrahydropterin/6-carboxytetrahydropterin synthase